jgi:hypothetical protein
MSGKEPGDAFVQLSPSSGSEVFIDDFSQQVVSQHKALFALPEKVGLDSKTQGAAASLARKFEERGHSVFIERHPGHGEHPNCLDDVGAVDP